MGLVKKVPTSFGLKILTAGKQILSFTKDIEDGALEQAINLAEHPKTVKHIALMPDCHCGYGIPIGGVAIFDSAVCPNAVGVDIGCGMIAVKTNVPAEKLTSEMLKKIVHSIMRDVPIGFEHHKEPQDWAGFLSAPKVGIVLDNIQSAKHQLGTLGGGNHFIEIQKSEKDGNVWLMIHSGSRGFGYKIARWFNAKASEMCGKWNSALPHKDLAFFPSGTEWFDQYVASMDYALLFALANRQKILDFALRNFSYHVEKELGIKLELGKTINKHHNFAVKETYWGTNAWVHRKGATRARKGEIGIIPGSMGSSSYIVEGKGNGASFHSSSHGAGRMMSRSEFNRTHTLEDVSKEIEGVVFSGWNKSKNGGFDLSEAPSAYKDIDVVMEEQKDLVKIIEKLTPIAVVKG